MKITLIVFQEMLRAIPLKDSNYGDVPEQCVWMDEWMDRWMDVTMRYLKIKE